MKRSPDVSVAVSIRDDVAVIRGQAAHIAGTCRRHVSAADGPFLQHLIVALEVEECIDRCAELRAAMRACRRVVDSQFLHPSPASGAMRETSAALRAAQRAVAELEEAWRSRLSLSRRDGGVAVRELVRLCYQQDLGVHLVLPAGSLTTWVDTACETAEQAERLLRSSPTTADQADDGPRENTRFGVSGRVLAMAVENLPVAHRERYREEWRSELYDLPRRRRLVHSARVLASSWSMRSVLGSEAADVSVEE